MITEDYVSFEVAKMLQEKGFDIPVLAFYWSEKSNMYQRRKDKIIILNNQKSNWNEDPDVMYSCPTHQMAMAWLRGVHNIKVNIWYSNPNYAIEYFEPNTQTGVGKFVFIGDGYPSYEDAVEAALKYSLENLI